MKPRRQPVYDPERRLYLLPLTQGQSAIVDLEDCEWLCQWNWCASFSPITKTFYAGRGAYLGGGRANPVRKTIMLHRALAERWGWHIVGKDVDHISRDTLDHRRSNLRAATRAQNCRNASRKSTNKSGFKGVHFKKSHNKWGARIRFNGKDVHLGYYATPQEAAASYANASLEYHKEYGRTESGSNVIKLNNI